MLRLAVIGTAAACLATQVAAGQSVRPRSGDYEFASTVHDIRALWVNPAGLGIVADASIMAEFTLERPQGGDLRLAQWTAGFNRWGLAIGYQRDRFSEDPNTGALRFGLALPFRRGAAGAAFSFYSGNALDTTDARDMGLDLGFQYRLLAPVNLGIVVRNIGRPDLRDSRAPLTGAVSLALRAVPRHALLAAEVIAAERFSASGYDVSYRGGMQLSVGGRLPITLITAVDLGARFAVDRWVIGFAVGGPDRVTALASGGFRSPNDRLDRVSLSGVASRALGAR